MYLLSFLILLCSFTCRFLVLICKNIVLFNVRLLCCCSWNGHQQTALINQVSRKKTDQERRNNGTNLKAIQRNSGATVAVTKSIFFPRGSLGASPQHYNAVFLILVFVFHFLKYLYTSGVLEHKWRASLKTKLLLLTSNTEATENKVKFLNLAYRVKGFQCHSNNSL